MNKQKFTQEQIELLKKNPFTKSVTPFQIRFTDEFKSEFWQACMEGRLPAEIFQEKGYDIAIIGEKRIANTYYLVSKDRIFRDTESYDNKVQRLEGEVKRLSFELEALKKIIALGNSRK